MQTRCCPPSLRVLRALRLPPHPTLQQHYRTVGSQKQPPYSDSNQVCGDCSTAATRQAATPKSIGTDATSCNPPSLSSALVVESSQVHRASTPRCRKFNADFVAGVTPGGRGQRGRRRQSIIGGGTGQLALLERIVGGAIDGTLNGARTTTDLLSVQCTLGSREQGVGKRPMPHPAHLRNRHNEEEGKSFVGRRLKILRLDQGPHSTVPPKKKDWRDRSWDIESDEDSKVGPHAHIVHNGVCGERTLG